MFQSVQLGAGHPPFMLDPSHEAEAGLPPGGVGHAESQTGQRLPCGAETDGDLEGGERGSDREITRKLQTGEGRGDEGITAQKGRSERLSKVGTE